jgi:hypothetical protein
MDASDLVMKLLLGGMLGMLGQGIRAVAGLKKVKDEAEAKKLAFKEVFETSTLLISIFIGFVAGALATLGLDLSDDEVIDKSTLLTLLAAGYPGTDFIEAFIKKNPLP